MLFITLLVISFLAQESSGQDHGLTSANVSEGPCIPNIASLGAKNINPIWSGQPRNYYLPIGSEACFRSYAEALLGRPAESEEELDSMKIRIKMTVPFPPIFLSYGFTDPKTNESRYINQKCPPESMNQVLCRPLNLINGPGTNTSGITTSLDTIMYTDNKSTLLIVRCLNDKVKDYKVLTTGPIVPPDIQKIISDKIQELGFDMGLLRVKNY